MIYNIIAIIVCVILPFVLLKKELNIKDKNLKSIIKENKYIIIIYSILMVGMLVRLVDIQNQPNGLNCDEASSGYEAYSIANYGIDRNGNSMPVFLLSWGSGQNALYTYMIIPFVKLFGLSVLSTRLPMAILGCISLIVMYKLLEMISNKKLAIIGLAFFAICPWHIMKSRWGLESNVFPDLVLIAIFFIIRALQQRKMYKLYIGFGFLGLCAYAYGTSYFFLPLFVIPLLIYLLYKKEIEWKNALISFAIVFIVSLPIILYVIINTFGLPQLKILYFTIPRMTTNRYEELSSVFSSDFINKSFNNFVESIKILIFQTDGSGWNSLLPYGITYIFSLPLMIIGVFNSFTKKKSENYIYVNIINLWFAAAVLLLLAVEPNINRINIIMIPIVFYTIVGIYEIVCNARKVSLLITIIYIVSFCFFVKDYSKLNFDNYYVFIDKIEEPIEYISNLDVNKIYVQYAFKEPYIYFLFYEGTNPNEFCTTMEKFNGNKSFDNVKSFGKYNFYLPENIEHENGTVYLLSKENNLDIDYTDWKVTEFEKFIVLENKEK